MELELWGHCLLDSGCVDGDIDKVCSFERYTEKSTGIARDMMKITKNHLLTSEFCPTEL